MGNLYTFKFRFLMLFGLLFVASGVLINVHSQSFSQNGINFNGKGSLQNGTSLTFGPDGRLYVTEYTGSIKIFTIERIGPGNYSVLSMEELKGIQSIQDHNDDGTLHSSQFRETIGLAVTGTAANPVIYVSSSDFRIGGGGGGGSGDVGLDTNSGIITRYSWNGSSWDEVDIVRGLPRSEENHATNGIEFATINGIDYLIVAQGGHTNAGGPSTNFAYTTEYALSAAILSVNLTMIEAMPVLEDNGRKYIYDLPTLDDPSRPNKNGIIDPDEPGYDGIDINDPFGGNDGLNQAIIVSGGPVQIFSPGYRNAYDLVVTQSGAVYVTDNGANGGWGGFPVNEGGANATNAYDPNEPGSTSYSGGEYVNNKDHLSLVTLDMQNYTFGSFYGGHPVPVRANPIGAGLYTNPSVTGTEGAEFRTQIYDPDGSRLGSTTDPLIGLPANWPPVQTANPQEGDWRGPGIDNPDGPLDAIVTTWGTNTNGIAEYTASNFEGAMKGDLLAGVNTGELRRVELNADGSLKNLTASFASGLGGNALGVACNGDDEIFPGTIWVGTLEGGLIVLEPQDFVLCVGPDDPGYDPNADNDFDGYTNQDEVDNGTDPCNGGSQPSDFDKAAGAPLISNLNDPDDDNDGIPDSDDPFQLGDPLKDGSDAFDLPVINELFSSNPDLKGYMGLGMTGLMNNGAPNPNWLNWLDRRDDPNDPNPNDILGGAIGAMTMQMTAGTALGMNNTQEKGFQYGIKVSEATGKFTVAGGLFNFNAPLQLYGHPDTPEGELGFFIGDGTQSNYIKFVISKTGLLALQEISDIPSTPIQLDIPVAARPDAGATFFFVVEPSNGEILLEYSFDNGPRSSLGTLTAQGPLLEAIQLPGKDLAVGFIGTSNAPGVELEGTWDYLNVTGSGPYIIQEFQDIEHQIGATNDTFNLDEYFDDDNGTANLTYTLVENTNKLIVANITGNILDISYPSSPASTTITVLATDLDQKFVEQSFNVSVIDSPVVLYRINSGGSAVLAIDAEMDWGADTTTENSLYLAVAGSNNSAGYSMTGYTASVDQSITPVSIFDTERYDGVAGPPNMTYSFPVSAQGNYIVRLYMANGWDGTSSPGQRVFDVEIEGYISPQMKDIDLSALFGHGVGGMIDQTVEVTDGSLDISFIHGIENPLINGIEILSTSQSSNPLQVVQLEDQTNLAGEQLDGSLVVQATGGDGNLSYSMTGAPAGIVIEPTNGQIGGTVDINANLGSPYTVTVTVDDSDEDVSDAVSIQFQWFIITDEPYIVKAFPEMEPITGSPDEQVDLNEFFGDNEGVENLTYSLPGYVEGAIVATITANILTLNYPDVPAESTFTIRATDINGNFVEQTLVVRVIEATEVLVLYRINAGGPAILSIDNEMDWGADTGTNNSPYLFVAGGNNTSGFSMSGYSVSVDQSTTPVSIFDTERYDGIAGEPNLTWSFPVLESGNYEIRLYMGNGYSGTSEPGQRIFDVSIEGVIHPELDDIDLSAIFGHQVGGVITKTVEVTDGSIDIVFLHGVENPLINGIEILSASVSGSDIIVAQIQDQFNTEGDVLDGSLQISATGGDGTLNYAMTGAPSGVVIEPTTGVISGTIAMDADSLSPYSVKVTVDDSDEDLNDAVTMQFQWGILPENTLSWTDKNENENYTGRHECSFVQAGDKFYLMGGRESSQTVDIYDYATNTWSSLIDSVPFEFNHFQATEYQGLIWIIGAFKTNNFPSELPAEHIWIFNPASNEWLQGPPIPANRQRGSAGLTVYNDKFYISGGNTIGHDGGYVSWFDEYDPATGIWTPLADAPRARDHFHSAVIGDKLYLAGGRLSGGTGGTFKPVIPEVDVYDFTSNSWSTLPADQNIPTPRAAASVAVFQEKLIVIGGEVDNELVYGVTTTDALKITEEYDPATGTWTRLADLNYERHGTQAIVSGEGISILAGSPNKGGGNQKNMEYLGIDAPVGEPSVASTLSMPDLVKIEEGVSSDIIIKTETGNVGVIVSSMEISGTNMENFVITSGDLTLGLIKPNSTHNVSIDYTGTIAGETAILSINYGVAEQVNIALESTTVNSINVEQIADQANFVGDVLDGSLIVSATGGDGALNYSMTGAPAGAVIDPVTGVISGTISLDAASEIPYVVTVTVDDSDEESADAVTTTFNWTVTSGIPVVTEVLPDLERIISSADENIDLNLHFSDNDGVENLVYTVEFNSDPSIGAVIVGNIITLSYPETPVISDITIRATDAYDNFVEQTFQVSVIYDPEGTLIEVTQIEAQENTVGDNLDGSLTVSATGGDGALNYSMTGAPAGVVIDPVTGVISGTIAMDADVASPYNVSITVDDSDAVTTDAVTSTFNWTVTTNQLPSVAITTPLENDAFTTPVDITIDATASDTDGTISKVEFFEGTTKLGEDPDGSNGWSYSWINVPAGTYSLTAVATDDRGAVTTSEAVNITVSDPVNAAPVVAITSPADNSNFQANGDISIIATASDSDGTIAKVEFFNGITPLGEGVNGVDGWSLTLSNAAAGTYSLTAKATDDIGAVTTSDAVNITVNAPPTVFITAPANNATLIALEDITISATASDSDGTIAKVEFFNGITLLGEGVNGVDGWSFTWSTATSGTYSLTAKATDDKGAVATSSPVNITVNAAPSVAIATPSNNATFITPIDITISATASDTDGTIAKVEFYQGTTKLGEDADGSNGWSYAWANVPAGTYSLTAVAIDDKGAVTTSTAVNISVSNPPSPVITSFSPTSGPIGTLVTINGNNFANATSVTFGPSSAQIISNTDTKIEALVPFVNGKLPSKVKITVTTTGGNNTSSERFTITSGTVPVNASPIVTINSPANNTNFIAPASIGITASASDPDGTVVKVEFFNGPAKLGEDLTSPYAFNWNNVATGNYVLTAKATDDKGAVTTSEAVNVSVTSTTNTAPVVEITSPANNSNFTSPASIGITASASDSDGTVVKVEFFNGVAKLGEDLTSPYSFTWDNVETGNYSLTAKATDDKGAVSTSASVNITVGAISEVAAPSNLFAEWATSSQVNLYWQDNSFDEDGFVLERAYKADFTGKVDIINLSANTISYQDGNLNINRAVYYRIKAVKGSLSSSYSNIASPAALKAMETSDKKAEASLNEEGSVMEEFINIKLYPNPANAEVYLQTPDPSVKINAVAMYDYSGRYIKTFSTGQDLTFEGNERYMFNILGMQNEVYILKVYTESSGVFTLRLIKED